MVALIEVSKLSILDGSECLVNELSLTVNQGIPVTILGETGSGKSLLANAIVGNLPQTLTWSGSILLFGENQATMSREHLESLWGRRISVLPQEPWNALNPIMGIGEQSREVNELVLKQPLDAATTKAKNELESLGLENDWDKIPMQLSGGMAQRAAYSAATSAKAKIVIADEPTKGLDTTRRDQIACLLLKQSRNGGLVTITHDVELALQLGGELIVMRKGCIVERGTAHDVLSNPQSDYAAALIKASSSASLISQKRSKGKTLLKAKNISKSRGNKTLFTDLSLEISSGDIIGIVGDSGVGKTTLADVLLGLQQADSGTITKSIDLKNPCGGLKIYQDPPAAFAQHCSMGQLIEDVIKLHKLEKNDVYTLMDELNLSRELLNRTATMMSGGELQRFSLLRALLLKPTLIVADEPTSRLDPITAMIIHKHLLSVVNKGECALVIISHDRNMVYSIADKVISM